MQFDCIVVGSGNAGSCAALSAVDSGCRNVLLIDRCPPEWVGGNGFFTAGAYRTVHGGLSDLLPIVKNVTTDMASKIDMEPYTHAGFTEDIMRLGDRRSDPALVKSLVDQSREAIAWLADRVNMPFILSFHRQAYEVDGRQKFWGGMVLAVEDGGKGMIAAHHHALTKAGVTVWFNTDALELAKTDDAISHLVVMKDGHRMTLETTSVILAAGGFESSAKMRQKHLGPGWENAKVST
jgi:succinate dehydrogenase/fumarate reductase flavoprotein subunit